MTHFVRLIGAASVALTLGGVPAMAQHTGGRGGGPRGVYHGGPAPRGFYGGYRTYGYGYPGPYLGYRIGFPYVYPYRYVYPYPYYPYYYVP